MSKEHIAFDFDGVLHTYKHWKAVDVIDGEQVVGMKELFQALTSYGYGIKIYTCRALEEKGRQAVEDWLKAHDMLDYVEEITAEKPIAKVYVDDRAIRFDGNVSKLFNEIITFKSWTEE